MIIWSDEREVWMIERNEKAINEQEFQTKYPQHQFWCRFAYSMQAMSKEFWCVRGSSSGPADCNHWTNYICRGPTGIVPVPALGHCKVPVPALGEFVPVVAPPWHDYLGLGIVLRLGTQFSYGAPSASTGSPFRHGAKTGTNSPSASTGRKKVPVPELGQCRNGG